MSSLFLCLVQDFRWPEKIIVPWNNALPLSFTLSLLLCLACSPLFSHFYNYHDRPLSLLSKSISQTQSTKQTIHWLLASTIGRSSPFSPLPEKIFSLTIHYRRIEIDDTKKQIHECLQISKFPNFQTSQVSQITPENVLSLTIHYRQIEIDEARRGREKYEYTNTRMFTNIPSIQKLLLADNIHYRRSISTRSKTNPRVHESTNPRIHEYHKSQVSQISPETFSR